MTLALVTAALNPADNPLSREFYELMWRNFAPAVPPFLVALVVTVALVLPVRRLAFRLGAVAHPGGRNIHANVTARLGGLAMAAGFTASAVLFGLRGGAVDRRLVVLLGVAVAVTLVMVMDDIRNLRASYKLGIQLVVSAVVPLVGGMSITAINLGGGHTLQLGLLAVPITIVWLVGMQNTMNFLDGVDGLAAGVAAIVAAALVLAAVNREATDSTQIVIVVLGAGLIGASLGFLLFNFNPARIFMGDSGSHFLGMTLGVLSIYGIAKGEIIFALLVPLAALAVPIADTALAIIRRRRSGVSIGHPDTKHIHHQLLDFGMTAREICLLFYSATGITASLGLMVFGHRKILAVAVVLLVIALSTLVGDRLSEVETSREAARARAAAELAANSGRLVES